MTRVNWFYKFSQQLCYGFLNSCFGLHIEGIENIPKEGGFILACNHVSYFDPPAAGSVLSREVFYFARKSLFKPGPAKWILDNLNTIPVDRDGDSDIGALKKTLKLIQQGQAVVLFPEGTRSKDGKLGEPKPGIGLIACKSQVPVIPTRILGTYEALKIGNSFPNWGHPIHVLFGDPLLPAYYDSGKLSKDRYMQAATSIMDSLSKLSMDTHNRYFL